MSGPEPGRAPVAVVGAGLMGHAIAQVFAAAGHPVGLYDPDPSRRADAPERIRGAFADRGEDPGRAALVSVEADLAAAVAGAAVVFEAGPESARTKRAIFAALDAHAPASAVLATNTSALPVAAVAAVVADPSRVLGAHFWNPAHLIPIVEVVRGEHTASAALAAVVEVLTGAGKRPVRVERDVPGLIGNRLQHALKREAIALVAAGVCDAETIDTVVRFGFGARLAALGPLEQSDLVGLDLTLAIHEQLMPVLDRRDEPHPLLRQLVAEGATGMAAGRGFRTWTPEQAAEVRARLAAALAPPRG